MVAPGARFGVYEIVGPLGAGGMGEVDRARDTRLNRDVAIADPSATQPETSFVVVINWIAELNARGHAR
jgi:serine/threonine protein kinase